MCLAIPTQIEAVDGPRATVNLAGTRADVGLELTPEAKVGDWVLVHAGYAITVISDEEAHETFAMLREMGPPTEEAAGP
jgi:hydrogenase expression/formation protein HypC